MGVLYTGGNTDSVNFGVVGAFCIGLTIGGRMGEAS
jgi:hypothetical protein